MQIKRFEGITPPSLKKGELATNEFVMCLGVGDNQYRLFQAVLDFEKDQTICGFVMTDSKIHIPSGTPLSRIQELFDVLPKQAISQGYNSVKLTIEFEDGDYINDTGKWIQLKDVNYALFIQAANIKSTEEKSVNFILDKSIEFYNCSNVKFSGIHFKHEDTQGAIYTNGNTNLLVTSCTFESKAEVPCITPTSANVVLYNCHLLMFSNQVSAIARAVIHGGKFSICGTEAPVGRSPKCLTVDSYSHIVIAGDVERLNLLSNSLGSAYFDSGLEVTSFTVIN